MDFKGDYSTQSAAILRSVLISPPTERGALPCPCSPCTPISWGGGSCRNDLPSQSLVTANPLHCTPPCHPSFPSTGVDGGPDRPARGFLQHSSPHLPASSHTTVGGGSARPAGTLQQQQQHPHHTAGSANSNANPSWTSVFQNCAISSPRATTTFCNSNCHNNN